MIRIERFAGMMPVTDPGLLGDGVAAYAANLKVDSGVLRGAPAPTFIRNLGGLTRRVFRLPFTAANTPVPLDDLAGSTWIEFQDLDTDVVRSPIVNDSLDRYYWCSPSTGLRVATRAQLLAGFAGYEAGVVAPTAALTASIVPGTGSVVDGRNAGRPVTRSYIYTNINQWGEESAPSPPVELNGFSDQSWLLQGFAAPAPSALRTPVTKHRIYRTITGASGATVFFYVGEIAVGVQTYTDSALDTVVSAGRQLESLTWAPAPAMDGVFAMPNGIFVGFKDNTLYFSENYRPHAWPAAYAVTVPHQIVGLGGFGNACVVCTTGAPAIVTGVKASAMALTASRAAAPCMSRRSIVSTPEGVIYATDSGLCAVATGGARVFTTGFISRDQWSADYRPRDVAAILFAGDYVALRGTTTGFMFPIPGGQEMSGLGGVVNLEGLANPQSLAVDPWTGRALYIADGRLFEWFPVNGAPQSYRWRSKEFDVGHPRSLGAAQALYDEGAGRTVTLRVWADGRQVYANPLPGSRVPVKLPSGFRATRWQFELEANTPVRVLEAAPSTRMLKRV